MTPEDRQALHRVLDEELERAAAAGLEVVARVERGTLVRTVGHGRIVTEPTADFRFEIIGGDPFHRKFEQAPMLLGDDTEGEVN